MALPHEAEEMAQGREDLLLEQVQTFFHRRLSLGKRRRPHAGGWDALADSKGSARSGPARCVRRIYSGNALSLKPLRAICRSVTDAGLCPAGATCQCSKRMTGARPWPYERRRSSVLYSRSLTNRGLISAP